jgi:hypothetical protein
MDTKVPKSFKEGNFSITLEHDKFKLEVFLQVSDKIKTNRYYRYYKIHLNNIFKQLVTECLKCSVNPEILLPYLQYLLKKFDNTCSKFESCRIFVQHEKPKNIYENECIFYPEQYGKKLFMCYQNLQGENVFSEVQVPITDDEFLVLIETPNEEDLISFLFKKKRMN